MRYLDALVREMAGQRHALSGNAPDTVYLGGGTPSRMEPGSGACNRVSLGVQSFVDKELRRTGPQAHRANRGRRNRTRCAPRASAT
jgi:coproporphyrinogen III oxidase-like Fe-S oxidoreductase